MTAAPLPKVFTKGKLIGGERIQFTASLVSNWKTIPLFWILKMSLMTMLKEGQGLAVLQKGIVVSRMDSRL